jgi:hypothetical protein
VARPEKLNSGNKGSNVKYLKRSTNLVGPSIKNSKTLPNRRKYIKLCILKIQNDL